MHKSRGVHLARFMESQGHQLTPVRGDRGCSGIPFSCVTTLADTYTTVDYIWRASAAARRPVEAQSFTLHWVDRPRPSCHAVFALDVRVAAGGSMPG